MTQQAHSWAYTPEKPKFKMIHTPQCSLQHYLQQPGHGSNLNVHQQRMDKDVVHIYNGILAIKRNKTEYFVEMWINLETVKPSEASQKKKNKYCILTNICRILKNGIDDLIHRAQIRDTDVENKRMDLFIYSPKGEGGVG